MNQTQNLHNLTTTANLTQPTVATGQDMFVTVLTRVDEVNRVLATLSFVVYFFFVLLIKELRTLSLFYVHHANLVGFIFVIMYMIYFKSTSPVTSDPAWFVPLCTITEVIWGLLKYLRSYSVILIAFYRLAAVFYPELFKKINKSYITILVPISFIWMLSGLVFAATKFGFNTTYGALFCIDGYSTNSTNTVAYLIVSSVLAIVLPFVANTVIYVCIKRRLDQTYFKLRQRVKRKTALDDSCITGTVINASGQFTGATVASSKSKRSVLGATSETRKNQRFNIQLISLNVCYLVCFVMSFILSFRYIIPDFNARFYYFRQILRVLNIFFQAMIPVLSLCFNPLFSYKNIKQVFNNASSRYTK